MLNPGPLPEVRVHKKKTRPGDSLQAQGRTQKYPGHPEPEVKPMSGIGFPYFSLPFGVTNQRFGRYEWRKKYAYNMIDVPSIFHKER